MEAHGSPVAEVGQRVFSALPKQLTAPLMTKVGLDRMAAIYTAIDAVRRGGTVSLIGVYGGQSDPMPMLTMFDKQLQLRMGQANVKRWVDDIMPLLVDDADPLGTEEFATHQMPLSEAPTAYDSSRRRPTARSRSSSSRVPTDHDRRLRPDAVMSGNWSWVSTWCIGWGTAPCRPSSRTDKVAPEA